MGTSRIESRSNTTVSRSLRSSTPRTEEKRRKTRNLKLEVRATADSMTCSIWCWYVQLDAPSVFAALGMHSSIACIFLRTRKCLQNATAFPFRHLAPLRTFVFQTWSLDVARALAHLSGTT